MAMICKDDDAIAFISPRPFPIPNVAGSTISSFPIPQRVGKSSSNILFSSPSDNDIESQKQKNKLTREFFTIAVPAFFQLAAEPLAGLVDTAYLGRLGPEVLGGAGVAISAQYAMSKLYNVSRCMFFALVIWKRPSECLHRSIYLQSTIGPLAKN